MKRKIVSLMFAVSLLLGADGKNYAGDICLQTTPEIPKDAIFIDVRTKEEYAFQHAKGAINIPVYEEVNGQRVLNQKFLEEVNRTTGDNLEKHIVIICKSGKRSVEASNILAEYGYEKVYNVEKGFINGYKKTALPTEK